MLKKLCLFFYLISVCYNLEAANLAKLAEIALKQNLQLKISQLEIEQSKIDEKTAHNAMFPIIDFSVERNFNKYYDRFKRD